MVDLRSDTVTRPETGMLQAMTNAQTGDDVFEEDATVNAFQQKIASLFGFEAGLFVPSGVMSNQIAINLLTVPGDEVIIDKTGHIFNYEVTSAALISSVQLHPVEGTNGKIGPSEIEAAVRPSLDWNPNTSTVAVENSTNKGGGACYTKNELSQIRSSVDEHGLSLHIDGARIWNAIEATGIDESFFGSIADTMSVCFSKGLGAPIGSMLLSSQSSIAKARRVRKTLGGGMRQVGLLAAAADYAVGNHRSLLADDHRRAKALAFTIAECTNLSIQPEAVETNIAIFDVHGMTAEEAVEQLKEKSVLVVPFGPQTLRATFHIQVDDQDLAKAQEALVELFG